MSFKWLYDNLLVRYEGVKNNYNNNNPGPTSTGGGADNIKSCKNHDGDQGCEFSSPTTILV